MHCSELLLLRSHAIFFALIDVIPRMLKDVYDFALEQLKTNSSILKHFFVLPE